MQMHSTSSLPLELWKTVLTHTSQADRARCSLVSRAFQAAAVAAMETVEVSCREETFPDSLQTWLDNHGQYVKRLQVSSWSKPASLALLACQHVQQLELARIKVAMGPNSSKSHDPGCPVGLTAMTKLHLCDCTVTGGLAGLSVLTALKELKLTDTPGRSQPSFPGSVFQHYRILTRLELAVETVTDLQFISCLMSLQELTLYTISITRGVLPGGLPASLRVLNLRPTVLDPVVLLGLTNLRKLYLSGSTSDFELAGGSAVPLLDAIAAMQQLEELNLWDIHCDWPLPSSAAYSSLTASSNLTRLQLEDCRLPVGALERMLPPAGTLHEFAMFDSDAGSNVLPWKWADVDRLMMHCPALRLVGLGVEWSDDLARLTRLSALTSLEARFAGLLVDDGFFEPGEPGYIIIENAAKFTGLKHLRLRIAGPVDMTTVLPLTALRQLTQLEVLDWTLKANEWEEVELTSSARPPLVWLKLLKLCAEYSGCQTMIMHQLLDQQAQLQQQATNLQQQQQVQQTQLLQATHLASAPSPPSAAQGEVAAARAEVAAACAQAAAAEAAANAARADAVAARADAAAARADAAAARADAAELRDQLAALQAVVQNLVHTRATE